MLLSTGTCPKQISSKVMLHFTGPKISWSVGENVLFKCFNYNQIIIDDYITFAKKQLIDSWLFYIIIRLTCKIKSIVKHLE